LPADKAISGIVLDANDQPVADAVVRVDGPDLLKNYHRPYYAKILTDGQGRFNIIDLYAEDLEISVEPPSGYSSFGRTFAHGGDTDIKVILGQTLYHRQSLVGKKLPDFVGVNIDFNIEHAKDTTLLLCFFDIEQRPSRSCIIELNKRIQGFNEKGIQIIAIQTAKTERSEIDNWIKENNISFKVGMIQEDEEKARTEWGIEALPWMILTDKEHIVIAEGFSLNDLDEKLELIK
jgi:hypothetical protein